MKKQICIVYEPCDEIKQGKSVITGDGSMIYVPSPSICPFSVYPYHWSFEIATSVVTESKYKLQQSPKLQAISIGLKPADAIPLTDAQKRTGDGFRQEFGSPALPFAQKRLYFRPQHLNRIHNGVVWRQIPQLYACGVICGVICVVCPRHSAAAFCPALPRIVQHFAHFSHLPVTYCITFCCSCQG